MSFQIGAIHLYNHDGAVRIVPFRTGSLNVITGASKTGKTALIEIVEYCLGSSRCKVPKGVIRNTVAWYALVLVADDSQILVARAAPPAGASSSEEVVLDLAPDVLPIPMTELVANTNTDGLKRFLTQKMGIEQNLFEPPEGQTRSPFAVQLRHALFYSFQRQDEIASKDFLFHRQGEQHIPQTIKDSLPFFLGTYGDEWFARAQRLKALQRQLALIDRRIREKQQVTKGALQRGLSILTEAQLVGLTDKEPTELTDVQVLEELGKVASWTGAGDLPEAPSRSALVQLDQERSSLLQSLRTVSREREALEAFLRGEESFREELGDQVSRLESIHLFRTDEELGTCPLCDSALPEDAEMSEALLTALQEMNAGLSSVSRERPHLADYQADLEERHGQLGDALAANRRRIEALVAENERLARLKESDTKRAHVAGRASLYIQSVTPEDEPSDGDAVRASVLRAQIAELEAGLDRESRESLLQSQLNRLSNRMSEWATRLHLEHSGGLLRFDLQRLTVVADTEKGPVELGEMGSGENWVSYHLIFHLALHEWFVR